MSITIGQFNESFPPMIDGVANVVKNYAYWMNKKYGRCCVVTPEYPDAQDDYGFEVYRYSSITVPTRREYRVGLPQMDAPFWHDLKKIPFDIVHAHSPFGAGMAARTIAKKLDIPFIATFHSKYRDDFKASLKSEMVVDGVISMIASFYESADEVWAVNDASIETLRDYGYEGPVHVMGNGCDISVRYPDAATVASIEKWLGIEPGTPLFMYIGQHTWQKNVKLIIEGLALLRQRSERFHMLFVGDGARRADMEHMVNDMGLKDCTTFAGRISDRGQVADIYLRSSAMLFPSMYDTSSLVPREAAACGCPTVFVRGSSTSQGVTEKDGFLIENNARSMADTVAHIIHNPEHAKQVGEEARHTLYISWEDAVQVAYDRYLYLIDRKRSLSTSQSK